MAMPQRGNTIEAIKRLEPPSRVRYGVSGRGPYLGSAWFVGNETLSVVQQGLNDDLDNADGEQGYKSACSDLSASGRIKFVEVFHDVFSCRF